MVLMGGCCCCCCGSSSSEIIRSPALFRDHAATASGRGLLVDSAIPDIYQPPPPPTPYETLESSRTKAKVVPESSSTPLMTTKDEKGASDDDDLKKSNDPQDEEDICPTCLDDYDSDNPKMVAKCGHHFHLVCILEWMERSPTCAVCDQEMVFNPGIE